MANASINGVKCPVCGAGVSVRVDVIGGYPGSFYNPPEPAEIEEIEEIDFEDCLCMEAANEEQDPDGIAWLQRAIEDAIYDEKTEIEVDEYDPW